MLRLLETSYAALLFAFLRRCTGLQAISSPWSIRRFQKMSHMKIFSEARSRGTANDPKGSVNESGVSLFRCAHRRQMLYLLGYALIFMVFLFFFPLIGAASSIVNLENLERIDFVHRMITSSTWVQSVMEGIFATLLLSVFMAFLPSTLHVIIASTFTLNSKAQSQLFLQQWYFWFQVIFVLLVTAIGTSLWQRFADVLTSPTSVVLDLAGSLPNTSTFYMSYIILQWSVSVLLPDAQAWLSLKLSYRRGSVSFLKVWRRRGCRPCFIGFLSRGTSFAIRTCLNSSPGQPSARKHVPKSSQSRRIQTIMVIQSGV